MFVNAVILFSASSEQASVKTDPSNPHKEPKNLQPAYQNTEDMVEAASTLQHFATSSLVKSSERLVPKRIIS